MSALPPIATAKAYMPMVMSALPSKADMCSAARNVRFGPKADIWRIGLRLRCLGDKRHYKPQFIGSRDLPRITPPIAGIYRTNPACTAMQVWPQLRRNEESCHCGSHDWPLHTHIPRVVRVR